jgi:uncharacterized protein YciU (UPF0263 family)
VRKFLAALVLVCLTALLVAQSQPPPPSPTIEAQNQQQHRASEKNNSTNTQQSIVGPIGGNQAAENQSAKSSQESTDNRIVWLTGVIALAAVAQVWAMIRQARYMRRGLSVTIKAARSARFSAIAAQKAVELAEKNAALTERAVVLLESARFSTDRLEPATIVIFRLQNFGRTVAENVTLTGACNSGLSECQIEKQAEVTIAPEGHAEWVTKSLIYGMQHEHLDRIIARSLLMRFKVEATYSDVFGKRYRYEAEGRYEPGGGVKRFLIDSSRLITVSRTD